MESEKRCNIVELTVDRSSVAAGYSPESNGMTMEAEESPLLRFVARKCLVKTL
jgi:hypothetical protein